MAFLHCESTCVRSTIKKWDPFVHFVRKLRSMFDREEVVWPLLFTWWKHFFVCSFFIDRGQKPFQFVRRGKEAIKLSSHLMRTMHWSAGIWIFMKENCKYKYKYKYEYKEKKVPPLCPGTWEAVRVQTRKRTLANKHNPTSSKQQANILPIGGSAPASPTPGFLLLWTIS